MEIAGAGGWLFVFRLRTPQGQTLSSAAHPKRAAAQLWFHMQAPTGLEPGTMVFRHPAGRDERLRCSAFGWSSLGAPSAQRGASG